MVIEVLGTATILAGVVFFLKKNKQKKVSGIKFDKISVPLKKEVDVLDMSFVMSYFKGLAQEGKIQQGKHIPFVVKTDVLKQIITNEYLSDAKENSVILASYNEESEEVENVMLAECRTIGDTIEKALTSSQNGIITLS